MPKRNLKMAIACLVLTGSLQTVAAQSISYYTIRNNMRQMTEAQFKQYARSLEGKTVTWVGWVEDVNEKLFGGYEAWIDMDAPHVEMSVQDVTFPVTKSTALKLRKNMKLRFKGTIVSVMDVLGSCSVNLKNVRLARAR